MHNVAPPTAVINRSWGVRRGGRTAYFVPLPEGEGRIGRSAGPLPPAGFPVAGLAFGDVALFPLRDRLGLGVAHHAGAIFQNHLVCRATPDALVDPLDVVGGGGKPNAAFAEPKPAARVKASSTDFIRFFPVERLLLSRDGAWPALRQGQG